MKMSIRNIMTIAFAMALLAAPFVQSATYYWDTDGDIAGGFGNTAGTWGTSAFWSGDDTGASATANTAITTADGIHFGTASLALGPLAANVGVDAAGVTVNSITFGSAQTTPIVLGTTGSTITLGGSTPTITVNNASNTISSILAGMSLTKAGSGTLTLTSTNTYSGGTTISGGMLKLTALSVDAPAILTNAIMRVDASILASGTYTSVANLGTRGGSFSASSGNVPVGSANANANIKGRNAFFFDGANALISGTAYANTGSAMTIFTVASSKAAAANNNYRGILSLVRNTTALDWNDGASSAAVLTADSVGNSFNQYRANGPIAGVGAAMPQGYANAFITEQTFNGTTSTFALTGTNGVTTTAANVASTGNFNIANMAIGGRYSGSLGTWWYGDVGEVLIFNSTLSPADIAIVRNYLAYKWFGIGSPSSAGSPLPSSTAVSIASGATFDLGGASQTIASLSDSAGSGGTITNSAASTATLTINPASGSTTFSGALSGPISLVKSGIATQVLAGASAYTGGTSVNNGTLLVNGSINGSVSVASGAYLGGTGAITGTVTFASGALALFTDSAPLLFTGPVTLNNNTVYLALSDNLAAGTYLLATNTTSNFSGTFAAAPVLASGSTMGDYRTITTSASAVRLIVATTDTTAPTPDPMTFAVNPLAWDASTVVMTATVATDLFSSTVEYCFTNTVNGNTSGWISGTVWTNTGLTKGVSYGYMVKARDASPAQNETAFSGILNAVPAEPTILWDANGAAAGQTDGNGTWLNPSQWWDGSSNCDWNSTIPNNAVIGNGSAGGTITVGAVTAGTVLLNNFTGTYTFGGTLGASTLTQNTGITIGATAGNVTFDKTAIAGSGGIIKDSPGLLTLGANPAPAHTYSGTTTLNGGVTMFSGNLPGGNLTLNGGVYEEYWSSTFTRGLGAAPGQVQILGGTSGFSENGSTGMTIKLGNGTATVVWGAVGEGTATGFFNPSTLVLQAASAQVNSALEFQNGIDLNGATRTVAVEKTSVGSGLAKISGVIRTSSGTAGLTKTGPGVLELSNANTYNGTTIVSNGILRLSNANALPGGIGVAGGTSALTLDGGVVELANGNFLRNLGTGSAQVQVLGGVSGFSARGGARTVNFNNDAHLITWGSADFNPGTLVLNSVYADNTLAFQNPIDLNGTTRAIAVNANTATVSGDISTGSGSAVGLTKSGAGTLVLAGNNSYDGTNTISAGMLSVGASANLGAAGAGVTFDGGGVQITGTTLINFSGRPVSFTLNKSVSFDINSAANTFTLDQAMNLGNGALTKLGAGTLVINQPSTFSGGTTLSAGKLVSVGSLGSGTITWATAGTTLQFNSDSNLTIANAWNTAVRDTTRTLIIDRVTPGPAIDCAFNQQVTTLDTGTVFNFNKGVNITSGTPKLTLAGGANSSDSISGTIKLVPDGVNLRIANITNTRARTWEFSGTSLSNEVYGTMANNGSYVLAITKSGTGTWTLSGANTYSGATTINAGTLALGANNVLPSATAVSIGNGTLDAATYTNKTVGTLTVTAVTGNATINLGSASSALAFANSSGTTWSSGKLQITGTFVPGYSLRFGTNSDGLSATQLTKISAPGGRPVKLDSNGYLRLGGGTLITIF